jgi:hypothetical protein
MNVMVIPEDFSKDQHILKPIIERMLRQIIRRGARVRVCQDPRLGGYNEALKWENIQGIIRRYSGMTDLFLLCIDRDGDKDRRAKLDHIEQQATALPEIDARGRAFFAENAWQEIEVWVLAGHDLLPGWNWQEIRTEVNPKERYFQPFAEERGLVMRGRRVDATSYKRLAEEAARRYDRIRRRCPEDIATLEQRIHAWINV